MTPTMSYDLHTYEVIFRTIHSLRSELSKGHVNHVLDCIECEADITLVKSHAVVTNIEGHCRFRDELTECTVRKLPFIDQGYLVEDAHILVKTWHWDDISKSGMPVVRKRYDILIQRDDEPDGMSVDEVHTQHFWWS